MDSGEHTATAANCTVLIIDDSPADRHLFARFLDRSAYFDCEVREAATSEEGLRILRESAVDCVLLDYNLPATNGVETLAAIRAEREDLPVILLTGSNDYEVDLAAMRGGAAEFLVKEQTDPVFLERAVRYALERQRAERALVEAEQLRALVETAGAAAHEINNPLTAVVGNLGFMQSYWTLDEDQKAMLDETVAAVDRIADIVAKMVSVRSYRTKQYAHDSRIVDFAAASDAQ